MVSPSDLFCMRCYRPASPTTTLRLTLTVTSPDEPVNRQTWRLCSACLDRLGVVHGSDLTILVILGLERFLDHAEATQARRDAIFDHEVDTRGWEAVLEDMALALPGVVPMDF